jgi:Cell division protein FtsI/penicillin-binding protein 2
MFGFISIRLCYLANGIGTTTESGYTQRLNIASRRGFIYDRNDIPIAGVKDGYVTLIDPSKGGGNSYPHLVDNLRKTVPYTIFTDTFYDDSGSYSVPFYRRYPDENGTPAAHIIGYINGDGIGVSGTEYYFDSYLTLNSGEIYMTYQADGVNNMFGGLPVFLYDVGYSHDSGVVLTLDIELQESVEKMWKNLDIGKGAVVIADIVTGEILVSASFPTFNTNNISAYLNSNEGEFINRCARGFTPGSVFKIITACAALDNHINYMYTKYECTGEHCYAGIAHGAVNMADAFANSCNGYFYRIINMIGIDRLNETAEKFGIGQYDYIDMFRTGKGKLDMQVPRNASIGQGGILCTPYEITRVICTIMNDGVFTDLHLFKGFYGNSYAENNVTGEQVIKKYTASVMKSMMRAVVTDGIGRNAVYNDSDNGKIGGKTASAQSGQYDADGNEIIHSWFAGYNGDLVITVFCEDNRNITAAEIFAEVSEVIK